MKRAFRLIALLGLFAAGRVASAGNLSGTYVGLHANAADLLQIVERPDGALLGHFEQVILSGDGIGINRMNASVSGAVNADTLVLTLKPAEFLGGAIPMSGTIQVGAVQLSGGSGGNSFDLILRRSSLAVYSRHVQQLTARASEAAAAKAAKDAMAKTQNAIQDVTAWMRHYVRNADVHLQRMPKLSAAYARLTAKMQAALDDEAREPPNSVARAQIDVGISQMSVAFHQAQIGLQTLESSFGYAGGKITYPEAQKDIARAQQYCGCTGQALTPICGDFSTAYANFQTTVSALRQDFANTESAWNAEDQKQQAIERQADRLNQGG